MKNTTIKPSDGNTFFPIISIDFMKAYLIHMRPYLLYVSGVAGLAGMAFAVNDVEPIYFLMAFIPFFLGYGFGQALTDCTQIDTDSISSPYRPLVKGEISSKSVMLVSLIGLALIAASLFYLNSANLIFIVLSILGLSTYTHFKKNYWFAGPFYNGWIVMLLPLMGVLACNEAGYQILMNKNIVLLATLTLFSYANFVLIGYLKDISADRETAYRTFPVVFGWNKSLLVGDVFYIISVISCFLLLDQNNLFAMSYFAAATIITTVGQLYGHFTKNKTEENSSLPIASTVRSFILWHLAVTTSQKPEWLLFTILFYIMFEFTLYFRPSKHQI